MAILRNCGIKRARPGTVPLSACQSQRTATRRSGSVIVPDMFLLGMSVILQINRDFPYQVELSFDELAMEALAWLEERSLEWDMYVDLPASSVRYCFRTLADATEFKLRFAHRGKGRPSATGEFRKITAANLV
jgi:hypothetical protein